MEDIGRNILFFTQESLECQYAIKEIMKRGLRNDFVFINIQRYKSMIPSFVTSVPYILDTQKTHIPMLKFSSFLKKLEQVRHNVPDRPPTVMKTPGPNNRLPTPLEDTEYNMLSPEVPSKKGISEIDIQPHSLTSQMDDGVPVNPFQSEVQATPPPTHNYSAMMSNKVREPEEVDMGNNKPFPFTQTIKRSSKISEDHLRNMLAQRQQDIEQIHKSRQQWQYQHA